MPSKHLDTRLRVIFCSQVTLRASKRTYVRSSWYSLPLPINHVQHFPCPFWSLIIRHAWIYPISLASESKLCNLYRSCSAGSDKKHVCQRLYLTYKFSGSLATKSPLQRPSLIKADTGSCWHEVTNLNGFVFQIWMDLKYRWYRIAP